MVIHGYWSLINSTNLSEYVSLGSEGLCLNCNLGDLEGNVLHNGWSEGG